MGKWIERNLVNILLVGGFIGLLFWFYRDKSGAEVLTSTVNILLVVAGLGLVIFIHELGHFLAAKACGVRVHTFSVGFGPPIPGCHFTRGETLYKLAVFPIGGYVHMQGQEDPGVEAREGYNPDDPRSFANKTVGQRMIIISAGVIMNVILGLGCFIYVYLTGKTEVSPVFGAIDPGSPAAISGVQAGSELLQVDDNIHPIYEDLFYAGAFAQPGVTPIYIKWKTPSGKVREASIIPEKQAGDWKPLIGVKQPEGLVLFKAMKEGKVPGIPGTPAAAADFRPGDRLLGVRQAGELDFRLFRRGWEFTQAEYDLRGKKVEFEVERKNERAVVPVEPNFFHTLGLRMEIGPIVTVQKKFAPEAAKLFNIGDKIVAVNGDRSFDPMRLPDLVTDRLAAGEAVEMVLARDGSERKIRIDPKEAAKRGTWNEEQPLGRRSPLSIPALGIAYNVLTTINSVEEKSSAHGKLQKGDIVEEIFFPGADELPGEKVRPEPEQWAMLFWLLQHKPVKDVELGVKRAKTGEVERIKLSAVLDKTWPMPDRGLMVEFETQTVYADGVGEAIALGFRDTYRTIGRIYLNLKALVTGNVSVQSLQGPIGIVKTTYLVAERGINYLVLLLGMLSINLAVINFLPIPILDGGHMVFLVVEKIRGKPTSDTALIIANTVGLVLIGCLMLFVIFLDVSKMDWFRRLFQS